MITFAGVAFLAALLPAIVAGALAGDVSLIASPLLAAFFAALWGAVFSRGMERPDQFGYGRAYLVVVLSFVCVTAIYAAMRPFPFGQAFLGLLLVGAGIALVPGLLGGAIATWLLRSARNEPNHTRHADEQELPRFGQPSGPHAAGRER